jgi:hypothetical protein
MPPETQISCTLFVTTGGLNQTMPFTIVVGEIRAVDPIPDGPRTPSLYWAYDNVDTFYTECPTFAWVEIAGIGTRLTLSDDQTTPVSIPSGFGPFRFYNQNYTTLSISSNGFIAMGSTTTSTYTETALPNSSMPPGFYLHWDDLYPPTGGGVWYYHDAANHRFIVEYDSVPLFRAQTNYQKFEAIFYDTTLAAADGNCEVEYMYQIASDPSSCTVGEQDQTFAIFIQNLFDGSYTRGCAPIQAGRAIRYTTDPPNVGVTEPVAGASFALRPLEVCPNPFARAARIRWQLARDGRADLRVYDASGRVVRTLATGPHTAGSYSAAWNGADDAGRRLANGIYFVRLVTEDHTVKVKTILAD